MQTEFQANTLSVTQVSQGIGQALQAGFPQWIWLEGEISGFKVWGRPTAKAWFFDLKDNTSTLSAVVWASDMPNMEVPREGEQVRALAKVAWAGKQGRINLNVKQLQPAGLGALLIEIERRRTALVADGLTERKRPLPKFPRQIGLITSPDSAAAADVLRVLRLRWPLASVRIYPSGVQGEAAPAQLIQALDQMDAEGQCDVCLLVRGGGSLTDLMAFNDEALCRRLVRTHCPVITGVGHETDTGLVDWVSDRYASTPSNAAELATPDWQDVQARVDQHARQIRQVAGLRVKHASTRLNQITLRLQNPSGLFATKRERLARVQRDFTRQTRLRIQQQAMQLQGLTQRLQARDPKQSLSNARARHQALTLRLQANPMRWHWQSQQHRLEQLLQRATHAQSDQLQRLTQQVRRRHDSLRALDPKGVLARGYAYVERADGDVVTRGADLAVNDVLRLRMQDHETLDVAVRVDHVQPRTGQS